MIPPVWRPGVAVLWCTPRIGTALAGTTCARGTRVRERHPITTMHTHACDQMMSIPMSCLLIVPINCL